MPRPPRLHALAQLLERRRDDARARLAEQLAAERAGRDGMAAVDRSLVDGAEAVDPRLHDQYGAFTVAAYATRRGHERQVAQAVHAAKLARAEALEHHRRLRAIDVLRDRDRQREARRQERRLQTELLDLALRETPGRAEA